LQFILKLIYLEDWETINFNYFHMFLKITNDSLKVVENEKLIITNEIYGFSL